VRLIALGDYSAVRDTIHQLGALGYADPCKWTKLMAYRQRRRVHLHPHPTLRPRDGIAAERTPGEYLSRGLLRARPSSNIAGLRLVLRFRLSTRVENLGILLETVAWAFQTGASPESMVNRYSTLSLSDVYNTIGYYLSHQDAVEVYL